MTTLFCSRHSLERAENLHAVWDAYTGPKIFKQGIEFCYLADDMHCNVLVYDEIPTFRTHRAQCKGIFIGHGIPGIKSYGLDEPSHFIDDRVCDQIDFAIAPSEQSREILARQLGISIDKVLPLGFPRTDAYFNNSGGKTIMSKYRRAYFYAPTFRYDWDAAPLPKINWKKIDKLLERDEVVVVKRHYFTEEPLVQDITSKVLEVHYSEPSTEYLIDCDVLVTDFSSMLFDGYILNKPSIIAIDYLDQYKLNRGVYLDYPYNHGSRLLELENNEEAFISMLRDAFDKGMQQQDLACKEWACAACDGHSSARVAELIAKYDR